MTGASMSEDEILRIANEVAAPHGLAAEIFSDIHSVGVRGDDRSYSPVVNLIGPFPGHNALAEISSAITSRTPVNRVTFQLAARP